MSHSALSVALALWFLQFASPSPYERGSAHASRRERYNFISEDYIVRGECTACTS